MPAEQAYTRSASMIRMIYSSMCHPDKSVSGTDQQVADLMDEEETAGYYDMRFDADRLISGVYVSRIKAGKFA